MNNMLQANFYIRNRWIIKPQWLSVIVLIVASSMIPCFLLIALISPFPNDALMDHVNCPSMYNWVFVGVYCLLVIIILIAAKFVKEIREGMYIRVELLATASLFFVCLMLFLILPATMGGQTVLHFVFWFTTMCAYTTFPLVLSYRNDTLMRGKTNSTTVSKSSVDHNDESVSSFPNSKHTKPELKMDPKSSTERKEKTPEIDMSKLTNQQKRALERERKHRLMLELITNPEGFFIFEQFLVSEFCNENLHFLRELNRFKDQCVEGADLTELEKLAVNIEQVFILENSPAQVNVSSSQRDKVRDNLKSFFLRQVKGLKDIPPPLVDQKSDVSFKPADSSSIDPPSPLASPVSAPNEQVVAPLSLPSETAPVVPETPVAAASPNNAAADTMQQLKDIFKVAEQEVVTMLFSGPWFRFLTTPEYLAYKKNRDDDKV